MSLSGSRTYVGFGFGAIQSGLFLYEAFRSGNFGRLVVAEVLPDVVAALRASSRGSARGGAGGHFVVNVAHADRIERADIGPVELENPTVAADRERLIEAIAAAEEIGTAIPSVAYYVTEGASPRAEGSLHRVLAEGLRRKAHDGGPRAVVYAAENHNHAAEILAAAVMDVIPIAERERVRDKVCFLNTVIGKMSGVVTDPAEIAAQGLAPVTPVTGEKTGVRAFLVEAFNRILISQIHFAADPNAFARGITAFAEKPDLLPFEEAKLYGHNATHALAAYLGAIRGVAFISDLREMPEIMAFLRAAFLDESGAALCRKYAGSDRLFTPDGYAEYADDLLVRMTNPYLRDSVERVGRDPQRKLGWDDRLVGTMRLCHSQGILPRRYALGAAAALAVLDQALMANDGYAEYPAALRSHLLDLWRGGKGCAQAMDEQMTMIELIEAGGRQLQGWVARGFTNLV